ncbi:cell envelope biogenesis protein OmpA [Leptospira congkakensis]|uniref:Cell envelope biogenesis protein OmpA n=2 Tax=Leptospira congkakensis TaxID=2484932 RepID=A0A4Z1A562_9LEPT|nr:cell envelope biogenesis protein OmpA [Leptospira congkakensis]TGL89407.1 cell envelope biogenesis protein OmpA [Leptospira congkakensis]TGL97373.1 cell envelope biogenesis protein OmpA [Leptospira congkakensis]
MLVGTGFLLFWVWRKSPKINSYVLPVRKEKQQALEKNTKALVSDIREFSVFFGAGSSQLEKDSVETLRTNLEPSFLSQIGYITLIGSADASGPLVKNRRLVKDRVRTVERYLVSLGISKDKMNQTYLEPSIGNGSASRRWLRSVKIQIQIET